MNLDTRNDPMRVLVKGVDRVVVTSGNALPDVIVGRGLREKDRG